MTDQNHEVNALTVCSDQPADKPYALQLLEHGVSTDQLEKLLELQERHDANEAKKAFFLDMAACQSEMPMVVEDAYNDQTKSSYASYKGLAKICKPVYTRHGFSLMFYEEDCPSPEMVRMCVDVMHRLGHTVKRHADIPLDATGIKGSVNKTKPHAKGSSFSYGRGYLMRLIFNLPTGDDDDGNAAGTQEFITDEQAVILKDLLRKTNADVNGFLKAICGGAETVDTILEKDFIHAKNSLLNKFDIQKKKTAKKAPPPQREPHGVRR